jgi:hypothetical protein
MATSGSIYLDKVEGTSDYACKYIDKNNQQRNIKEVNSLNDWLANLAIINTKEKIYVDGALVWMLPVSKDSYRTSLQSEVLYNSFLIIMKKVLPVKD